MFGSGHPIPQVIFHTLVMDAKQWPDAPQEMKVEGEKCLLIAKEFPILISPSV